MDESRKITIGERTYLIGSLDCFQQFHVARRLGPMLLSVLAAAAQAPDDADFESLLSGPLVEHLATMNQEDVDFVLCTCLGVVRVQLSDNGTAPLWDKTSKQLRYQDLQMPAMLQLTIAVCKDNLGSFFPTRQPE
jgi:hypothetical protein